MSRRNGRSDQSQLQLHIRATIQLYTECKARFQSRRILPERVSTISNHNCHWRNVHPNTYRFHTYLTSHQRSPDDSSYSSSTTASAQRLQALSRGRSNSRDSSRCHRSRGSRVCSPLHVRPSTKLKRTPAAPTPSKFSAAAKSQFVPDDSQWDV